MESWYGEAVEK